MAPIEKVHIGRVSKKEEGLNNKKTFPNLKTTHRKKTTGRDSHRQRQKRLETTQKNQKQPKRTKNNPKQPKRTKNSPKVL